MLLKKLLSSLNGLGISESGRLYRLHMGEDLFGRVQEPEAATREDRRDTRRVARVLSGKLSSFICWLLSLTLIYLSAKKRRTRATFSGGATEALGSAEHHPEAANSAGYGEFCCQKEYTVIWSPDIYQDSNSSCAD